MATSGRKLTDAAKARQARSKALDKAYRSNAAKLKRLGVLTSKVNARAKITRGTRTKINKFRDVLEGRAIPVRASREVRASYAEKGILDVRGPFVIAPKEFANQRARISRGMIQMRRPLKNGQEEYVILPWKSNDLYDLIERMRENPDEIDELKEPDEFFSFRLYGHNSADAFPDVEEMRTHLEHYMSRLGDSHEAVKHITFQRFRTANNTHSTNPHVGKEPVVPYNSNRKRQGPKGTYEIQRDAARAARKARYRAAETEEQRTKRLAAQKVRQAAYRRDLKTRRFEQ